MQPDEALELRPGEDPVSLDLVLLKQTGGFACHVACKLGEQSSDARKMIQQPQRGCGYGTSSAGTCAGLILVARSMRLVPSVSPVAWNPFQQSGHLFDSRSISCWK